MVAYGSDRILLLFDVHKLDISDEFKSSIEISKGHYDEIRCILNKADAGANSICALYMKIHVFFIAWPKIHLHSA